MLSFQILELVLLVSSVNLAKPIHRPVNQNNVTIEQFPYLVSIRDKSGSHFCGGSIVTAKFVLTAAHCTDGRNAVDLSIQYGVTNISVNGPNVIQVKSFTQHKGYNSTDPKGQKDDISLLEVANAFPINLKKVKTVPFSSFLLANGPYVLAGWGSNSSGSRYLQVIDLKLYKNTECESLLKGRITDKQICAGVYPGEKGQCIGDSGGALFARGTTKLRQVGIESWSVKPCGSIPLSGIYTKFYKYIRFILDYSDLIYKTPKVQH